MTRHNDIGMGAFLELGRQKEGSSPWRTKTMAIAAKDKAVGSTMIPTSLDIGAGAGAFTQVLAHISTRVLMMDFYPPQLVLPNVDFVQSDLNNRWPLPDGCVDFGFALEVIEHVENPRHFVREFIRVLHPGGYGYMSTPNNHSWMSKLTFLVKGQHRLFQKASYPAHITPLLQCDVLRILTECNVTPLQWFYSNHDTLPLLHCVIRLPGKPFSDTAGILFRKPL